MKVSALVFLVIPMSASGILQRIVSDSYSDEKLEQRTQRYLFKDQHLIVGTIHMPPYIFNKIDNITKKIDPDSVNGYVHQIILWLARKYMFTFEYVDSVDGKFGAFVGGSWNGLVGMAARGEIDFIATGLSITLPRSSVIDYTFSYLDDPMSIVIPFPDLETTISGISKPFQYEVWMGIIISLLVVAIILWLLTGIEIRLRPISYLAKIKNEFFSHFWFLFRAFANADSEIHFSLATRLVVSTWCLTCVVLVNSYTSSLVSYITAPKFVPLLNSIHELAESKDILLTVPKDTSLDSTLLASKTGDLSKLGNSLRDHPENVVSVELTAENIGKIVYVDHKAFGFQDTYLRQIMYDDYLATRQCRFFILNEAIFPDQTAFGVQKRSQLAGRFSHELIWLRQTGLLSYWIKSFLPKAYRCSDPSSFNLRTTKKLSLNYLSGAFVLYGAGVVFAILALLGESIAMQYYRYHEGS